MNTLANPANDLSHEKQIDELREQTIPAEEMGYECIWLGEHHFGPYGQ